MSSEELESKIKEEDFKFIIQSFYEAQTNMHDMIKNNTELIKSSHSAVQEDIANLRNIVEPMAIAWNIANNFGTGLKWVAKYIITPLIVLLGAVLTLKNIWK